MKAGLSLLASTLTVGVFALAAPASAQEPTNTREIRGRVVDSGGQPVEGLAVGTNWSFDSEGAMPSWRSAAVTTSGGALRSDSGGRFAGTLYFRGRPVAITAVDLERDMGGTVIVTSENVADELVLTVVPLLRVRGRVEIELPLLRENTVRLYAFDPRAPIAMATAVLPGGGDFELALPPGPYELSFVANELKRMGVEIEFSSRDIVLPPTVIPPTDLARLYGQPAPEWTVTAARGIDPPVRLSDFEGSWVLMEYWSYW